MRDLNDAVTDSRARRGICPRPASMPKVKSAGTVRCPSREITRSLASAEKTTAMERIPRICLATLGSNWRLPTSTPEETSRMHSPGPVPPSCEDSRSEPYQRIHPAPTVAALGPDTRSRPRLHPVEFERQRFVCLLQNTPRPCGTFFRGTTHHLRQQSGSGWRAGLRHNAFTTTTCLPMGGRRTVRLLTPWRASDRITANRRHVVKNSSP